MKKSFFILVFVIVQVCQSQTWIGKGAEWHHSSGTWGFFGFIKSSYVEDTLIKSLTCQNIKQNYYQFNKVLVTQGPMSQWYEKWVFVGIKPYNSIYTFVSNDSVYYYDRVDSVFKMLYDFGANVGDVWDFGAASVGSNCQPSIMHVDSIQSYLHDNKTYKKFYLRSDSAAEQSYDGWIHERFGYENARFFPWRKYCPLPKDSMADFFDGPDYLRCYSDSAFSMFKAKYTNDCEIEYLYLSIPQIEKEHNIFVYPNPASHFISVSNLPIAETHEISIVNLLGNTIYREKVISTEHLIPLNNCIDGIYYLEIKSNNQTWLKRKISIQK